MSIEADTQIYVYTGDGVTRAFPFPARFLAATDIVCGINGVQALPASTTGAGGDSGGTVTFASAPAAGTRVVLLRRPKASQLVDLVNGQTVLEGTLDNALDKLTMLVQYLLWRVDRALVIQDFAVSGAATFNAGGNRITGLGDATTPTDAVALHQLTAVRDALTAMAAESVSVFGSAGAVGLTTVDPAIGWLHVLGYYEAGDGGGATYVRVPAEPAHPGKLQDAAGAWFELRHAGFVTLEQFGGIGATTYTVGMADSYTAFAAANAYASPLGVEIRAVMAAYRLSSYMIQTAPARRVGVAKLYYGGAETAWETPALPDLPGAVGGYDPAHPESLILTSVTSGTTWYDAFARRHRLPSGRQITTAYRGVAHSLGTSWNTPPDPTFGEGYWGDVIVSYSDDEGRTWSEAKSVFGNMFGGSTTHCVYTAASGVDHDGVLWLIFRRLKLSDLSSDVVFMKSRDGETWSAPTPLVINSIEDSPLALGANGQPAVLLVFGDVVPIPGAKNSICFSGRIAANGTPVTIDGLTGVPVTTSKYVFISDDGGETWDGVRCLSHFYTPYMTELDGGVLKLVWRSERTFPDPSLTSFPITEEAVIVPVSRNDIAVFHRINTTTLLGSVCFTRDGGATWRALDEAVGGSTEQPGVALVQAGHVAEYGGALHFVLHAGTRPSGSAQASVPYGHYVVVAKVRDVFAMDITKWTIARRISFQWKFQGVLGPPGEGVRDVYIGVWYDHVRKTCLCVTHDEKVSNRQSELVSYAFEPFGDMPPMDAAFAGVSAKTLVVHGDATAGGVVKAQDARTGKAGVDAQGGFRLIDVNGADVFEIMREAGVGRVDMVNMLPSAVNAGFAVRVVKDVGGVDTETQVLVLDAQGVKPFAGAVMFVAGAAGGLTLPAAVGGALPCDFDTTTNEFRIKRPDGTIKKVTMT
ncbi:MAG: exo-alpha-sialidase [Micropruina sp.]|nr:exo-alpha-sialidase [Micropruina sp.]